VDEKKTQAAKGDQGDGVAFAFGVVAADFSLRLMLPYVTSSDGVLLASRFALAAAAAGWLVFSQGRGAIGLGSPRWGPGLRNGALIVGGIAGLLVIAGLAAYAVHRFAEVSIPLDGTPAQATAWGALRACLLYPVLEEVIYRGVLFPPLERRVGPLRAILASGLVFQGLHFAYGIYLPHHFVGGMLLAWSFRASRSLIFPMALHALWNALMLLFWHCAATGSISAILNLYR
jgi:membrane protease YdiL (CAAX protease family)